MHTYRSAASGSIKRSVNDRLGSCNLDRSISTQDHRSDLKRQRQDDTRLVHGLSAEPKHQRKVSQDNILRSSKNGNLIETQGKLLVATKTQQLNASTSGKVSQDNILRSSKNGNLIETQGKLLGATKTQQLNASTSGVSGTKGGAGAELASAKKPVMKSASTLNTMGKKKQDMAELTVASFLQSLGLSKYALSFQAEEVDMLALKLMNDNDFKAMGVPMGPRKKILLGLASIKVKK